MRDAGLLVTGRIATLGGRAGPGWVEAIAIEGDVTATIDTQTAGHTFTILGDIGESGGAGFWRAGCP